MESCDKGKELRNMEINEVSEQCELSPKSNSTITHQLNTIELINNCVESQESEPKLKKRRKFESSDPASKRDRNAPISVQGFGPITAQQQQQQHACCNKFL